MQGIAVMASEEQKTEWIGTEQAAEIMGVTASNVRYLCKQGLITCIHVGKSWGILREDAENYVRTQRGKFQKLDE
jgi:hypothetical protein